MTMAVNSGVQILKASLVVGDFWADIGRNSQWHLERVDIGLTAKIHSDTFNFLLVGLLLQYVALFSQPGN